MNKFLHAFQLIAILIAIPIIFGMGTLTVNANEYIGLDGYKEIPHSVIQYHVEQVNEQEITNPVPGNSTWFPYSHQEDSGRGFIWMRLSISQLHDLQEMESDGKLQLFLYPSPYYYEIYQNNQLVHQSGKLDDTDPRKRVPRWDILSLDHPSDDVYIRLQGKIPYHYTLGTEAQLVGFLLKTDMIDLISIIGFFVTGLMALLLYLYNRKHQLLLFYALFIIVHFSIWPSVTYLLTKQLFFPMASLIQFYLTVSGQVIAVMLLLLLLGEIIDPGYRRWVSRFTYLYVVVGLTGIATTAIYENFVIYLFPLISVLIMLNIILALVVSIGSIRKQKNTELLIFSFGIILFIFMEIALNLALTANMMHFVNLIKIIRPFSIVLPGAIIIIRRYRKADTQAKEYAASLQQLSQKLEEDNLLLEQRVFERTGELQETNRLLEESIQKRMEAAVEIAALEERNRIAQEIHDIVGHTLTTTIVQIEAGRRLIAKQPEQAIERMETSQKLIRKGLDEIRTSVRLLKESEWNYELPKALMNTIEETMEYAGIQVKSAISDLPPLTMFQKNVIYMALKEGITNGIKHGGARAFFFILKQEDNLIIFQLKNNGVPAHEQEFGFGLGTMKKRVESLHGNLLIGFDEEWNYVLDMRFPVSQ